ncbi:hypothetical protein CI109_105479 [Kwoniella shandongensis]|uniref:Uncharacterized protein n=1 Tax=Kwoniella shandongensis TaxID=1734106 RepID=A0A5M6C2F1_9TREE|nr:uncharacterized protein CI109_002200 [Kwoniella shandongensis]KAA5529307.1 hypothetical protein CI109_002200 [Kwoniella shandongensis]
MKSTATSTPASVERPKRTITTLDDLLPREMIDHILHYLKTTTDKAVLFNLIQTSRSMYDDCIPNLYRDLALDKNNVEKVFHGLPSRVGMTYTELNIGMEVDPDVQHEPSDDVRSDPDSLCRKLHLLQHTRRLKIVDFEALHYIYYEFNESARDDLYDRMNPIPPRNFANVQGVLLGHQLVEPLGHPGLIDVMEVIRPKLICINTDTVGRCSLPSGSYCHRSHHPISRAKMILHVPNNHLPSIKFHGQPQPLTIYFPATEARKFNDSHEHDIRCEKQIQQLCKAIKEVVMVYEGSPLSPRYKKGFRWPIDFQPLEFHNVCVGVSTGFSAAMAVLQKALGGLEPAMAISDKVKFSNVGEGEPCEGCGGH